MSSKQAREYHSITFVSGTLGSRNTWDDWGLVPTSRPAFAPPDQKTSYIEVPGASGQLDLSEAFTGYPSYENRTGSFEFYVLDYGGKEWFGRYTEIMEFLHNYKMSAILDDEPEYFYQGRFSVGSWSSEKDWSKIAIDYEVDPYKRSYWTWDSFNFKKGVIPANALNVDVGSDTEWTMVTYSNDDIGIAPLCPYIYVVSDSGKGMDVRLLAPALSIDMTRHLPDGTTLDYDFVIGGGGPSMLWFRGKGYVRLHFIEGRL